MDGKPAGMTANVPHGTIKFSRKEELCVAKIVAIANQKGGVGKTTTAVNLSSCVAALGKRVLIVDLDPQGNTTTGYGIPKRSVEKGTYEILIGEARASEAIRKTEYRTDVIGSNTRLAGASLEMIDLPARESRLRKALAEVQKDYDFIFIDCPPSLDLLTLNGLSACDSVLIPVQCEYYALEGLSELISTLKTIRKKYNPYLDIEGVVFTMFSLRYNLTVQVVEQVQKYFGSKVYKTTIPRSIRISEAPSYGQPINFYEPKGKGSEAYMDLAIEFVKNNRPHEPKKGPQKKCTRRRADEKCSGRLNLRGNMNGKRKRRTWPRLDSLFEDAAPVFESGAKVDTLPLREIEPDPEQPRKTFDEQALGELAASIAEHGLLQPIAVRPRPRGGYSIVAGERAGVLPHGRAERCAGGH